MDINGAVHTTTIKPHITVWMYRVIGKSCVAGYGDGRLQLILGF